jgi:hypothetical protein
VVILLEAGRRQTNKEIADGLRRGGIATTSSGEPFVRRVLDETKTGVSAFAKTPVKIGCGGRI